MRGFATGSNMLCGLSSLKSCYIEGKYLLRAEDEDCGDVPF